MISAGTSARAAVLAAAAGTAAWQLWACLPPHQRTLIRMRILDWASRAADRAGAFAGARGIALEAAAGTERAARGWYELARVALGTVSEGARRAYDRARDAA